jgi:hypothetical protein
MLRAVLLVALIFGFTEPAFCDVLSFAPTDNNAVFWIDQSRPTPNVPATFDKWGLVFIVPAGQTVLNSATFYVESSPGAGAASFFQVKLSAWSSSLSQPVGAPIFESSPVLFSTPNPNPPDPIYGVRPTSFSVESAVTGGDQYVFEILGDGAAGILTAKGNANGNIYESQSNINNGLIWIQFGSEAFRSDIFFGPSSSAVPEPSSLTMAALVSFCVIAYGCYQRCFRIWR